MAKKTHYTVITPLPSRIPRQLAIDMLHSHGEIIELNPLVIGHNPISAPKDAAPDEFFSVWHEVHERIQYLPGMGRMGSGKISFKGVFHDMPWGLQTHTYAPAGVDLRIKYQIKGTQPGEANPEPRELGSKAPADGLYLQEDIEITCNFAMVPFVKKGMQQASAVLVARLLKKAELLDAGQLQAMVENGRLKTVNPAVQNHFHPHPPVSPQLPSQIAARSSLGPGQTPYSPQLLPNDLNSAPTLSSRNSVRNSYYPPHQHLADQNQQQQQQQPTSAYARQSQQYNGPPPSNSFAVEMPGSYHYNNPPPNPAYLRGSSQNSNPNRASYMSELSGSSPRTPNFSTPQTDGSSPHIGGGDGQSPRPGGGGSQYGGSDTTATSELPALSSQQQQQQQVGGYHHQAKPMGSPGMQSERFSVASEMPTYER